MDNKKKFIITKDPDTVRKLKQLGYEELPSNATSWFFYNNPDIPFFMDGDNANMLFCYTDILTF